MYPEPAGHPPHACACSQGAAGSSCPEVGGSPRLHALETGAPPAPKGQLGAPQARPVSSSAPAQRVAQTPPRRPRAAPGSLAAAPLRVHPPAAGGAGRGRSPRDGRAGRLLSARRRRGGQWARGGGACAANDSAAAGAAVNGRAGRGGAALAPGAAAVLGAGRGRSTPGGGPRATGPPCEPRRAAPSRAEPRRPLPGTPPRRPGRVRRPDGDLR